MFSAPAIILNYGKSLLATKYVESEEQRCHDTLAEAKNTSE